MSARGSRPVNIGVVGATGQVGVAMRQILAERDFPVGEIPTVVDALRRGEFTGRAVIDLGAGWS